MSKTTTPEATARPVLADDDATKTDGHDGFFVDSVRRSVRATATVTGGVAGAVGDGIRAYGETLTNENATRFAVNNGFVEGTLAGYAKFFDTMAATARQALDDVRGAPEFSVRRSSGDKIDYELLAMEISTDELAAKIADRLANR